MADRLRGKIKSFDIKNRTGLISQKKCPDLLFHQADIQGQRSGSLNPGSVVEFTVSEGEKKLMAKNITLI